MLRVSDGSPRPTGRPHQKDGHHHPDGAPIPVGPRSARLDVLADVTVESGPPVAPGQGASAVGGDATQVIWGRKIDKKAEALRSALEARLQGGEHLVAVFTVNQLRPMADLLIITDQRLLQADKAKPPPRPTSFALFQSRRSASSASPGPTPSN